MVTQTTEQNISGTYTITAPAPQYTFKFDTIGQVINRSIGYCVLPLRPIWYGGIIESSNGTASKTMTFAAALCQPIDPSEDPKVSAFFGPNNQMIFDPNNINSVTGGIIVPPGTSPENAELLISCLQNAIIYPGDEAQEPCPLIVADKGWANTNANRGLRYIILPNWPLELGMPSQLSIGFKTRIVTTATGLPGGEEGIVRIRLPPDGYTTYETHYFAVGFNFFGACYEDPRGWYFWSVDNVKRNNNNVWNSGTCPKDNNHIGGGVGIKGTVTVLGCNFITGPCHGKPWSGNYDPMIADMGEWNSPDGQSVCECWNGYVNPCLFGHAVYCFGTNRRVDFGAAYPSAPTGSYSTYAPGATWDPIGKS